MKIKKPRLYKRFSVTFAKKIGGKMKALQVTFLVFALAGCATKQYHHTSITDENEAKRQQAIDDAYCTKVAIGSIKVPQVDYQPTQSYRSSGTIAGYDSDGGYSNYTYSGTTRQSPSASFSQGFANGMNIGNAIAAQQAQNKLHHGCMLSKGWSDQPVIAKLVKPAGREKSAAEEWEAAVDQFLKTEALRDGGIDYRNDPEKMENLDFLVKRLANDPRNSNRSMLWFLVEADTILREYYASKK